MTKIKLTKGEFENLLDAVENAETICKMCNWWWVTGRSSGQCRFKAPELVEESNHRAVWPVTDPYDGCGDFDCPGIFDPDLLDDEEIINQLILEERDIGDIVKELRESLIEWKASHPEEYTEAIGEIAQGNTAESYYLVRTLAITKTPDFDRIPKAVVIDEILRLNQEIKFVIHRHEDPPEESCCCDSGEKDGNCCK